MKDDLTFSFLWQPRGFPVRGRLVRPEGAVVGGARREEQVQAAVFPLHEAGVKRGNYIEADRPSQMHPETSATQRPHSRASRPAIEGKPSCGGTIERSTQKKE